MVLRPVLKWRRLRADVAVVIRSSGGRDERGPDCEFTVILEGRGLEFVLEQGLVTPLPSDVTL